MEPNKFEKHIKEQLQNREIPPSEGAWKKISDQLDDYKRVKGNPFLRYAIAASFIGILIVSIYFFQTEGNSFGGAATIVDAPKEEPKVNQEDLELDKKNGARNALDFEENRTTTVSSENSEQKSTQAGKKFIPDSFERTNKETTSIASSEGGSEGRIKINGLLENSETGIDTKVSEVLVQVDLLEQNNRHVSNEEIDSLLRSAQRELIAERIFKDRNAVDAMALLSEVEDELDQSFRDQIFEKLKSGFLKARTAVADRNR